jgi:20S proteasome subunit beta 2
MSFSILAPEQHKSGFNFGNVVRNSGLETKGFQAPKAVKTGTTIAGCVFKDGVILAADSRATSGSIVADKECQKLYNLAPNM